MWRKELPLQCQSALIELARERVSATLLARTVVRDGDRVCAVMMARRHLVSGRVIWVTLVNGAAPAQQQDQAIRARTAAAIAGFRAQNGIPAE